MKEEQGELLKMPPLNPNRQAVLDYVYSEIERHLDGEIERFTTGPQLVEMFGMSYSCVNRYLRDSNIPADYLAYRTCVLNSQTKIGRIHSDEAKRRIGDRNRGKVYSQATREKIAKVRLGTTPSEATRKRLSQVHSGRTHTEQAKRKIAEANSRRVVTEETKIKLSLANLGENSPNYGKSFSLEHRERISRALKGKYVGEKSWAWKGGTSYIEYPQVFQVVMREYVLSRDSHTCQFCDALENGKSHCVHHIDHNKENNSETNLITLCELCHNNESASSGALRNEWTEWCSEKVAEIYASISFDRKSDLDQLKANLEARLVGAA